MDNGVYENSMSNFSTSQFTGQVHYLPLDSIRPSHHNPRGVIRNNESFERLVTSVAEVGLLVPLVVRELAQPINGIRYELVDGERRFCAAKELSMSPVPAHVIEGDEPEGGFRKLMFHLHMTRQQWEPMEQCRSLVEVYPQLRRGLRFEEKPRWVKKLAEETGMPSVTARDRVRVLAWSKDLKKLFFRFDEQQPKKDIYSYVLAIEASVIEPSFKAFPDLYNHHQSAFDHANEYRGKLLGKTIDGFQTGAVRSREQIRSVSALFLPDLPGPERRVARSLFTTFLKDSDIQFEDMRAEIDARLPSVARERTPKPQRLLALIRSLQQILQQYDSTIIDNHVEREASRKKLRHDLSDALEALCATVEELQERLDA